MSFVQKKGSKIVFIDEEGESTVGCWWNDVIGREFQILITRLVKKYLVLSTEQMSGLSLNWWPLVDV